MSCARAYVAWSEEDHATAVRMQAEGKSYAQIARRLNRTVGSVNSRLNHRLKPTATKRLCLCCRHEFLSQGGHNRLCSNCRGKDFSPYAPL